MVELGRLIVLLKGVGVKHGSRTVSAFLVRILFPFFCGVSLVRSSRVFFLLFLYFFYMRFLSFPSPSAPL